MGCCIDVMAATVRAATDATVKGIAIKAPQACEGGHMHNRLLRNFPDHVLGVLVDASRRLDSTECPLAAHLVADDLAARERQTRDEGNAKQTFGRSHFSAERISCLE
jgi:hypothetical protein